MPRLNPQDDYVASASLMAGLPTLWGGISRSRDGKEEWKSAERLLSGSFVNSIPTAKNGELRKFGPSAIVELAVPNTGWRVELISTREVLMRLAEIPAESSDLHGFAGYREELQVQPLIDRFWGECTKWRLA